MRLASWTLQLAGLGGVDNLDNTTIQSLALVITVTRHFLYSRKLLMGIIQVQGLDLLLNTMLLPCDYLNSTFDMALRMVVQCRYIYTKQFGLILPVLLSGLMFQSSLRWPCGCLYRKLVVPAGLGHLPAG